MKIRSIMSSEVVTIDAEAHLGDALELMDDANFRHLPVVEPVGDNGELGERLVGVISDRDLLGATGWLPARVIESRGGTAKSQREGRVREVMRPALSVSPDDLVGSVSESMMTQHIGCLPVLEKGKLTGIVTQGDILDAYCDVCSEGASDPAVSNYMSDNPKTLGLEATLADAENLCRGMDIRHLPIIHQDRVVGILSDRDLRRARGCGRPDGYSVQELMIGHILEVDAKAPLSVAARAMAKHKISCLPVVEHNCLVGILTVSDVLDHCVSILGEPVG